MRQAIIKRMAFLWGN